MKDMPWVKSALELKTEREAADHNPPLLEHVAVNHPKHYTSHPSGIECIEVTRHMNFNCGNATKYIWRADLKHGDGGIEDLEKAVWYIQDEIKRRKGLRDAK
jgi:hypothetical protein